MKKNFSRLKRLYSWFVDFLLHKQLGRYLLIGSLSFFVNVLLLTFFVEVVGFGVFKSQLLAAEGTIIFGFVVHHNWTYRGYKYKSLALRFAEFNVSALAGAAISTLSVISCTRLFHTHYLTGLGIGAVLAVAWNYVLNLHVVWSKRRVIRPEA